MKTSLKAFLKRNANVPNVLTLIRLLLIPAYLVLFVNGRKYAALIVFLSACLTDLFDGLIARKCNQITDLGKLMDPLADKLMILTVMFSMTIGNSRIPAVVPVAAVAIVLGKELFMMVGGLLMLHRKIVVYSFMIGKVAHCLFIAGLTATFFHEHFVSLCAAWPMTPDLMLIWAAVVCTLCAMVFYTVDSVRKVLSAEPNASAAAGGHADASAPADPSERDAR